MAENPGTKHIFEWFWKASNGKIGHFLASLFADSIPFPYDIPWYQQYHTEYVIIGGRWYTVYQKKKNGLNGIVGVSPFVSDHMDLFSTTKFTHLKIIREGAISFYFW